MIKHAKDTYSSLPIQPKANPLNSVDNTPCWAGKLTEPMPAHPLPVVVEVNEEDELTPEKWLAQQDAKRRIIATGQIKAGVLTKLVVDAAIATRAAECGLTADHLTNGVQKAIHAQAIEARHAQVHAFADELAAMDADLAALRAQVVEPVVRLSDAQLAEIEAERPGEEFSTQPFLF
jgi:hypothetical protein